MASTFVSNPEISIPNDSNLLIIEEILKEFNKLYQGFQLAIDLPANLYTFRYYSPDNDSCYSNPDEIFNNISTIAKKFPKNTTVWIKCPDSEIKHILE